MTKRLREMEEPCCNECRFLRERDFSSGLGFCYRYPPQVVSVNRGDWEGEVEDHRPTLEIQAWACGEFQPREEQ